MNNSNNKKRTGPSKPSGDRKKSTTTSKPAMDKRSQNRKPAVKKDSPNVPKPIKSDEIRLNKYISNSGACSRRDADIYIQSGNVKVNGIVVTEMGHKVKAGDVGIVTQDYFLFPWRKIKNTLLIAARQNKSLKSRNPQLT